jgi:4-azaleucine resistance transporter AzlC
MSPAVISRRLTSVIVGTVVKRKHVLSMGAPGIHGQGVAHRAWNPAGMSSFTEGMVDALPVAGVYAASGLALGVLARQALLGPVDVGLMSLLVFAGSTQFAAVGLLIAAAPALAILSTTLLLSLRNLTYGAALAPSLRTCPEWKRLLLAFGLTDEVFALTFKRFRIRSPDLVYVAGVIALSYPAWVLSTALAARVGGMIAQPEALGLDVAFPAIFLGLVLPALRTRLEWETAGLAVVLVLAGRVALPEGMALLLAGLLAPLVILRTREHRQSVAAGQRDSGDENTERS